MSSWWLNTVIYEVYVDKFAKDFKGLGEKLPYLTDLGIGAVHILPHYPSPMADDGYDVSDYTNVRADLGTLEDFEMFAKSAHESDIKIIVDLVLNHTSIEHPWFKEACAGNGGGKRDYYLWSASGEEYTDAVNP